MDQVQRTGEPIVITKNGRPVARLGPLERRPETLFGAHRGLIEITGDIISPIDDAWGVKGPDTFSSKGYT